MKCGQVAVIGKANAGKSTLINVLVGEKVAIVSPKPQTTRDRILGVLTEKDYQIVFVDTPGFYKAENTLNSVMQKKANDAAKDVDLILLVIDVHQGISESDIALVKKYSSDIPMVIALTKTDITTEKRLIENLTAFTGTDKDIVPVSARKGKNLNELKKVILSHLPDYDDYIYPIDIISDKSEKFMISEIMREKILLKFDKEIPHGVAIIVNEFKDKGKFIEVNLDIVCEKPNHKAILIGKQGQAIKEASSFARMDMEKFLGKKVFLTTYVKVKENWRDSVKFIKEYGYGEDGY